MCAPVVLRRLTVVLFLVALAGCNRPYFMDLGKTGPVPKGFPRELLSFSGPVKAFGSDGKAWDSYGVGSPTNVLFLKGQYWVCTQGYVAEGNVSNAFGCWSGPSLTELKPYPGNPIMVNPMLPWTKSCLEGPDLNTDGKTVFLSYIAYSQNCDDLDHGAIAFSSTSVDNFPAGFTRPPAIPPITRPPQLRWIFRPFVIEIEGVCYNYVNAGREYHPRHLTRALTTQPVVASFKTSGPCATTEMKPDEWKFNRIEITHTQEWEGPLEVEEPQVFRLPSGLYVMTYGGAWTFKAGYAYTTDPVHGTWTKLDTNPIKQDGVLWLARTVQLQDGHFAMLGNFNNTPQMNLWQANGK